MTNPGPVSVLVVLILALGACAAPQPVEHRPLAPIETVRVGPNRELLVNGEPFLPIMSWLQAPENFDMLRELGFNTFMGNQSGVSPLQQAQAARSAGGYAVAQYSELEQIEPAIGHPHLLAWHQHDEPDLPRAREDGEGFEPRTPVAAVADYYRNLRDAGAVRPVFVTFTSHFMHEFRNRLTAEQQAEHYPAYARYAEVLGYDHYPIYGWGTPAWLNRVASGVEQLVELGEQRKPVYAWIETSKGSRWMPYEQQPDVLPEHTRFQVWGAIIGGATAIGYFTHAWQPEFAEFAATAEMRRELARLNGQLTRLAPAILATPSEREIRIELRDITFNTLPTHHKATEHAGHLYLFAQNIDLDPNVQDLGQYDTIAPRGGEAIIHVQGLEAGTTVEILDADRTITAGDGSFRDSFGPLQERLYRIPLD